MADFQYRIITQAGKEKKGTIQAKNVEQATQLLKAEQNIVLEIGEAGLMSKDINISFGKGGVKPRDFSIFCRQFVSIIEAGVSVVDALGMLTEQTENKTLKKAIDRLHEAVSKGESLADAMRKEEKIFPSMLCNMVDAGEASGNLEIAFRRMAIQFEKDAKLRAQAKKAFTYPIVLLLVLVVVVFAMMTFVIPTFMEMFDDIGSELPTITKVVVAISDFFVARWWLLILIAAVVFIAFTAYRKTDAGKHTCAGIALRLPVFGNLQKKKACAQLGRTLCTLLGAGVPMIEAIGITARSMDNIIYRDAMNDCKEQIMRGVSLSKALESKSLFPAMVTQMVAIGEETGNIEEMLENVAKYYEDDVEDATNQMTALMEPALIVVMAGIVGTLVMAIMLPMVQLYNDLG